MLSDGLLVLRPQIAGKTRQAGKVAKANAENEWAFNAQLVSVAAPMQIRLATLNDAPALAQMNRQLIVDAGHRDRMDLAMLTTRMEGFLTDEYTAAILEKSLEPIGYALYSFQLEHIYRHFFIAESERRRS